jgi:hypothetical protein
LVGQETTAMWQQLLILILNILAIPLVSRYSIHGMLRQIFWLVLLLVSILQHPMPLLVLVDLRKWRANYSTIIFHGQLISATAASAWPSIDFETLAVGLID